jgi:hypothetical protein
LSAKADSFPAAAHLSAAALILAESRDNGHGQHLTGMSTQAADFAAQDKLGQGLSLGAIT